MTETHTHPHNTDQARAEHEAAPSAAKRTLGKHRFRFLHRERRGNVNWLAMGFSAPWLVFLLMPLDSFLTTPELAPVRWTGAGAGGTVRGDELLGVRGAVAGAGRLHGASKRHLDGADDSAVGRYGGADPE